MFKVIIAEILKQNIGVKMYRNEVEPLIKI